MYKVKRNKKAILFGIPPHSHVALAMDDLIAMESIGYECYTTPFSRNNFTEPKVKKVIGTATNAFRMVSKIRKLKPDFLFLNSRLDDRSSIRDYLTVFILKTFIRKLPTIVIKTHGSDPKILTNGSFFFRKVVIPYLVRHVDLWIFLSEEEKKLVVRLNPEMGKKSEVAPNIVVPERCIASDNFINKYPLPQNKFVCLFAGRLDKEKGVFDILKSIPFLNTPEVFHFLFVGKGTDMDALIKESKKYSSIASIEFTGFLPDAECDQFYTRADVLLFPTYYPEGFPMALFKSVACGLPVITTSIRAAADHLSEPENTLWVEPKSPKHLAAALEEIFNNQPLREQMKVNNQELGKKFSHKNVAMQLHRLLTGQQYLKPVSV